MHVLFNLIFTFKFTFHIFVKPIIQSMVACCFPADNFVLPATIIAPSPICTDLDTQFAPLKGYALWLGVNKKTIWVYVGLSKNCNLIVVIWLVNFQ